MSSVRSRTSPSILARAKPWDASSFSSFRTRPCVPARWAPAPGSGCLPQLQDLVDDLLGGLFDQRGAVVGAVRDADAGEQQPQVVPDLGDGAHRRTRVPRRRLLVDGDGRRQPFDEVDVGLVHLPEELPGIGREGFHVPALALGVDRVERQRRLPRPGQPGEHDQLVPRQLQRDVLEVVLTSTTNQDRVRRHRNSTAVETT
jgi:hypothetical protein